jgi:hypothetical protein
MVKKPKKATTKIEVKDLDSSKNPKGGKQVDVSSPKLDKSTPKLY